MYTRPIIYKVYSVIIFAFSIFSFLGSIATLFIPHCNFLYKYGYRSNLNHRVYYFILNS